MGSRKRPGRGAGPRGSWEGPGAQAQVQRPRAHGRHVREGRPWSLVGAGGADLIFFKGKISSLEKNQPPTSKTCHESEHRLVDTGALSQPGAAHGKGPLSSSRDGLGLSIRNSQSPMKTPGWIRPP